MGARAGRKQARFYKIRTYGVKQWRHYRDKCRRKSAKKAAIEEQERDHPCVEHSDPTCPCDDPDHARVMYENGFDVECRCGQIFRDPDTCRCGCGVCCNEENREL